MTRQAPRGGLSFRPDHRTQIRFWRNVDVKNSIKECWFWKGPVGPNGYGVWQGKPAHRRAWELAYQRSPSGWFVLHSCDETRCCNPRHLRLGTTIENTDDINAKKYMREVVFALTLEDEEQKQCPVGIGMASMISVLHKGANRVSVLPRRHWMIPPNTRISETGAIAIKRDFFQHRVRLQEIAFAYNVTYHEAYEIVSRRTWSHLP